MRGWVEPTSDNRNNHRMKNGGTLVIHEAKELNNQWFLSRFIGNYKQGSLTKLLRYRYMKISAKKTHTGLARHGRTVMVNQTQRRHTIESSYTRTNSS